MAEDMDFVMDDDDGILDYDDGDDLDFSTDNEEEDEESVIEWVIPTHTFIEWVIPTHTFTLQDWISSHQL